MRAVQRSSGSYTCPSASMTFSVGTSGGAVTAPSSQGAPEESNARACRRGARAERRAHDTTYGGHVPWVSGGGWDARGTRRRWFRPDHVIIVFRWLRTASRV